MGSPNGQSLINALASVTGNTAVTLSPPSLFFGTQLMATSSAQGTITLTNTSGS